MMPKNSKKVNDTRVPSILKGAEKRLLRLGKRRGTPQVKIAYRQAAQRIHSLVG